MENDNCDLMLNITSEPCLQETKSTTTNNSKKSQLLSTKMARLARIRNARQKRSISTNQGVNQPATLNFIGEVGRPEGENEKLPNGTKLKFKYANFGKISPWSRKETNLAKQGYKHLIKGDIILGFINTNLHEIKGYCSKQP